MEEQIVSKDEIVEMFSLGVLEDNEQGWLLYGQKVQIIALHEQDPKYVQDVTDANFYKIVPLQD